MFAGVLTTTSLKVPGARAGEVALSVWALTKVTGTDRPPIVMVVGSTKSVPEAVSAVPPAAGPEAGVIEKMIRCENSEVLPAGSVAVAEMRTPASVAIGSVTSIAALPEPSVVTCVEPR